MATTTPNYLWSVPTSSDLVKNGATAIETLGDSVDASLWNSGYGQAGKNKIINGDFRVNQRAFTSTTTTATYGFDRFLLGTSDGTATYSAQTFTAGAAPVAGYEGTNFAQIVTTGQTLTTAATNLQQRIESVRTFAGQTATFSFWAKATTGTPNVIVSLVQNFGTGGSPSASVTTNGTVQAITTAWARYSFTIPVPSISGKTIGTTTDGYLSAIIYVSGGSASAVPTVGIQSNTFQIWGVQAEYGSYATPFQTASNGNAQAELAMCQRYFYQFATGATKAIGIGAYNTTTEAYTTLNFPVTMRTTPTLSATTGTGYYRFQRLGGQDDFNSLTMEAAHTNGTWLYNNTEMLGTAGVAGIVKTQDAAASLAFSAEL
jgi:hypothetical protein